MTQLRQIQETYNPKLTTNVHHVLSVLHGRRAEYIADYWRPCGTQLLLAVWKDSSAG